MTRRGSIVLAAMLIASCAKSALVDDSPEAVTLTSVAPSSPANDNAPTVSGSTAPRANVVLFASPHCAGGIVAHGVADASGHFAVHAAVADDSTSTFSASVTSSNDAARCSNNSLAYVEDSTPPDAPTLDEVLPGAVASESNPRFVGHAEAGSEVRLFSDAACGTEIAHGSASDFASSGLSVSVAGGATITVHANATDAAGNVSACSTSSLTFHNSATDTPAWRGPTSRVEVDPSTGESFIVVDGTRYRPIFISVNPQAITDEATGWTTLLAEIDLATSEGMPIIDLMLANRSRAFLAELAQRLGSRQVWLWLRFDLWIPELANVGVPELESLSGQSAPGYREAHALSRDGVWSTIPFYSSLDDDWLAAESQAMRDLLEDINASDLATRVIGVRPTYLSGGEWFQPPLAFHDGTVDENPPNAWPWSNPDVFSVGDYSANEQADFHAWLPTIGFPSTLPFPTPADRITPKLGRSFVIGADGSGASAALYHRYQSERVATLQTALAHVVKEETDSKALVMVNNGYLFSLAHFNGSLHTALEKVLSSPDIDAISAPYNYDTEGARRTGFAMVPHGPMDSSALHGKLWIHEDDSRPYWSSDGFRTTTSWAEDESILLRNATTALVHGNALYEFDLPNQGWFGGNPAHAEEIRSVDETVQRLESRLAGRLSDGPVKPQVAVFIDDSSYQLYPEFGLDGAATYQTANDLILRMVEKISRAGVPVRYYLLDDLGNANLDVGSLQLVFFLNTPRLTQTQRALIQSKLMNGGRTLYFQYVSGLFDESLVPSWSLASPFCPGVTSLADIEASTSTAVTTVDHGSYRLAYSPRGASAPAIDALIAQSGVHRYATNAVVDGAGSMLMVHTASGPVSVALASTQRVVDLTAMREACAGCTSFSVGDAGPSTSVLELLPPITRRLFRYEFAPGSVGGVITTDERTYCGLSDGAALVACGFTSEDYANAPITPYGQLSMTYVGACDCTAP